MYQKNVPERYAPRRMFQKDVHREGNIVPSLGTDVAEECSRKICTERAT